jgi:O-antigen/teichoic acid export membrane protein
VTDDSSPDDITVAAQGSATNYVAGLLQACLFAFHAIGARVFGRVGYGAYVFAWSVVEIGNKITVAGLDKGVMRAVAAERQRGDAEAERRALAMAARIVTVVGLLVCGALWWMAGPVSQAEGARAYAPVLRVLAPAVWLWGGMMVIVTATVATRTMRYNLLVRGVGYPALMIASVVIWAAIWPAGGGLAQALAHLCALAATFSLALYALHRVFGLGVVGKSFFRAPFDWPLARHSAPYGVAEVLHVAIHRVDVIVVGVLLQNPALVAHYGACVLLAETISSIRYAFDPIFSPVMADAPVSDDRTRLEHHLKILVRWVTLLGAPVFLGVAVFGDHLLALWGPSYREAFPVLLVLATAHLFDTMLGLHQWAVVMSGRRWLDLINSVVALAVVGITALALVPHFGLMGAAVATLIGNVVFRTLQAVEAWRLLGVHGLSPSWGRVVVAAGCSGAAQVAVRLVVGGPAWIGVLLAVALGLACYNLLLVRMGLAPEEQAIVKRVLAHLPVFRRGD